MSRYIFKLFANHLPLRHLKLQYRVKIFLNIKNNNSVSYHKRMVINDRPQISRSKIFLIYYSTSQYYQNCRTTKNYIQFTWMHFNTCHWCPNNGHNNVLFDFYQNHIYIWHLWLMVCSVKVRNFPHMFILWIMQLLR